VLPAGRLGSILLDPLSRDPTGVIDSTELQRFDWRLVVAVDILSKAAWLLGD